MELLYTVFVVMKGRQEKKEEKEKGKEEREKRKKRRENERKKRRDKREEREKRERERERERERGTRKTPRVLIQHASVRTVRTPPCVPATGPHVFNMRARCRYTRRRPDGAHGGVLNRHTGGFSACQAVPHTTTQHTHTHAYTQHTTPHVHTQHQHHTPPQHTTTEHHT